MQSVPVTIEVANLNPDHYVIKVIVSDLRQVGGFLGFLWAIWFT
jgi:hypothetical protein